MFALRRVAVRAIQFQPTRQLSTLRPITSSFQSQKPSLYRSFHQSRKWLAEEEQKKESPAEAAGGETVTAEPSASEVKEESVATPEVADAAQNSTPAPAESAAQEATQEVKNAIDSTKDALSSVAETAQNTVNAAAQQFPSRDSGGKQGEPSKIIYIGNLFFEVTAPQLEAEFGRFGEVTNSRVVTDTRGLSKGFGYIEFASQDAADRAVRELDQKVFQGRRMAVQYHVRREPRRSNAGRSSNKPSKTLFIGNMSYQMSDRDLNDLFRQIRNVLDVRVAIDRRSGQPRGFAHADFIDEASATKAKQLLEQKVVYGRQLRVDYSQSSTTSSPKDD
ncbi:Nuclear localization sequence-binding protein [Pseudocercospora fuligena]|uniref:Nuclear localization sequence-binding protein n=1 Tax=Pseudocercospora fuligena TaxID=685502 RepID=A0A8H6R6P7_9PEZI|nr:Nuclear localization sequence-binding protein [Pseudocercospora fuligena]